MTQAYPLQWPAGQPRTERWKRSKNTAFKTSQNVAQNNVIREIGLLGGRNIVISTNLPLRKDGMPYADGRKYESEDPAVAVYFSLNSKPMCFACDKWDNFANNMHSIALTIGALRGIERWGSGHMMQQAFSGFAALPAPSASRHWTEILELTSTCTRADIDHAFRRRAQIVHPDKGGTSEQMAELQTARANAYSDVLA